MRYQAAVERIEKQIPNRAPVIAIVWSINKDGARKYYLSHEGPLYETWQEAERAVRQERGSLDRVVHVAFMDSALESV